MDPLAGLLDGPRARGAFLLRSLLSAPWSLRIQDRAPLSLITVLRGEAWLLPDGGEPVVLRPGDVAVTRGPAPYTVSDDPGTAPQAVIHPGQECSTPGGEHLELLTDLGVRTWGNDPDAPTVLLTGTYRMAGEISRPLLSALPPLLVLPGETWHSPLVGLLGTEISRDEQGQAAVLDRLLDLLLIAVLRTWFSRRGAAAPRWYLAHTDPVVGLALRLLDQTPARPWTVATLAAETGVSRAALARRFAELVGEPPMTYLTGRRLALAADLLREPEATVGSVARRVGYGSGFALSTAFKRVHGVSPQQHRSGLAGDAAPGEVPAVDLIDRLPG
jgi:AraC-like DNA-binding protein